MRGEMAPFFFKFADSFFFSFFFFIDKTPFFFKFRGHANFSSNDPFLQENGNADAYNFGTGVWVPGVKT